MLSGGNDIALQPTLSTIINVGLLVTFASIPAIENGSAWGFGHLKKLFGMQTKKYIEAMLSDKPKPKKVIICMLYFIDENNQAPSWASTGILYYIIV